MILGFNEFKEEVSSCDLVIRDPAIVDQESAETYLMGHPHYTGKKVGMAVGNDLFIVKDCSQNFDIYEGVSRYTTDQLKSFISTSDAVATNATWNKMFKIFGTQLQSRVGIDSAPEASIMRPGSVSEIELSSSFIAGSKRTPDYFDLLACSMSGELDDKYELDLVYWRKIENDLLDHSGDLNSIDGEYLLHHVKGKGSSGILSLVEGGKILFFVNGYRKNALKNYTGKDCDPSVMVCQNSADATGGRNVLLPLNLSQATVGEATLLCVGVVMKKNDKLYLHAPSINPKPDFLDDNNPLGWDDRGAGTLGRLTDACREYIRTILNSTKAAVEEHLSHAPVGSPAAASRGVEENGVIQQYKKLLINIKSREGLCKENNVDCGQLCNKLSQKIAGKIVNFSEYELALALHVAYEIELNFVIGELLPSDLPHEPTQTLDAGQSLPQGETGSLRVKRVVQPGVDISSSSVEKILLCDPGDFMFPPLSAIVNGPSAISLRPKVGLLSQGEPVLNVYHVKEDDRWHESVVSSALQRINSVIVYHVSHTISDSATEQDITGIIDGLKIIPFMVAGPRSLLLVRFANKTFLYSQCCSDIYGSLLKDFDNSRYEDVTSFFERDIDSIIDAWINMNPSFISSLRESSSSGEDIFYDGELISFDEAVEKWGEKAVDFNLDDDVRSLKSILAQASRIYNNERMESKKAILEKLIMKKLKEYKPSSMENYFSDNGGDLIDKIKSIKGERKKINRRYRAYLGVVDNSFSMGDGYSGNHYEKRISNASLKAAERAYTIQDNVIAAGSISAEEMLENISELSEEDGGKSIVFSLRSSEDGPLYDSLEAKFEVRIGFVDTDMISGMVGLETIHQFGGGVTPASVFFPRNEKLPRSGVYLSSVVMPFIKYLCEFSDPFQVLWAYITNNNSDISSLRIKTRSTIAHILKKAPGDSEVTKSLVNLYLTTAESLVSLISPDAGADNMYRKALKNLLGLAITTMASGNNPYSKVYKIFGNEPFTETFSEDDFKYIKRIYNLMEPTGWDLDRFKRKIRHSIIDAAIGVYASRKILASREDNSTTFKGGGSYYNHKMAHRIDHTVPVKNLKDVFEEIDLVGALSESLNSNESSFVLPTTTKFRQEIRAVADAREVDSDLGLWSVLRNKLATLTIKMSRDEAFEFIYLIEKSEEEMNQGKDIVEAAIRELSPRMSRDKVFERICENQGVVLGIKTSDVNKYYADEVGCARERIKEAKIATAVDSMIKTDNYHRTLKQKFDFVSQNPRWLPKDVKISDFEKYYKKKYLQSPADTEISLLGKSSGGISLLSKANNIWQQYPGEKEKARIRIDEKHSLEIAIAGSVGPDRSRDDVFELICETQGVGLGIKISDVNKYYADEIGCAQKRIKEKQKLKDAIAAVVGKDLSRDDVFEFICQDQEGQETVLGINISHAYRYCYYEMNRARERIEQRTAIAAKTSTFFECLDTRIEVLSKEVLVVENETLINKIACRFVRDGSSIEKAEEFLKWAMQNVFSGLSLDESCEAVKRALGASILESNIDDARQKALDISDGSASPEVDKSSGASDSSILSFFRI